MDISDHGVLIEGDARLLPGTHLDAHIVTTGGRVLVRSRVVRAFVWELRSDAVTYRGALAFERRLDTAPHGYQMPGPAAHSTDDSGTCYPERSAAGEASADKSL